MDGKPQICGSSPSRNSSPSGPPWPESRKHGSVFPATLGPHGELEQSAAQSERRAPNAYLGQVGRCYCCRDNRDGEQDAPLKRMAPDHALPMGPMVVEVEIDYIEQIQTGR